MKVEFPLVQQPVADGILAGCTVVKWIEPEGGSPLIVEETARLGEEVTDFAGRQFAIVTPQVVKPAIRPAQRMITPTQDLITAP